MFFFASKERLCYTEKVIILFFHNSTGIDIDKTETVYKEKEGKVGIVSKAKNILTTAKEYWTEPPKGNYILYKEVATLSGAGFDE